MQKEKKDYTGGIQEMEQCFLNYLYMYANYEKLAKKLQEDGKNLKESKDEYGNRILKILEDIVKEDSKEVISLPEIESALKNLFDY